MLVLQGENYHLMGSLTPNNDSQAKFGQLYIADTENEIENRANCLRYFYTNIFKPYSSSVLSVCFLCK